MAILFILLNTGLLTYLMILTPDQATQYILAVSVFLMVITGILIPAKVKAESASRPWRLIASLIVAAAWIVTGYWLIAGLCVVLGLLQWISGRSLVVSINANGITYPSWPVKNFAWKEIDNMILKDDLLTLNLRDGKYIQQVIEENATDEKEFNEFCLSQSGK